MPKHGESPPIWKKGGLCYKSGLTLETAKKMLEAGEAEAEKQGVPMVIAIADCSGNLIAIHRMDNVILASLNIAQDKAYTAVLGKMSSLNWGKSISAGLLPALFIHERLIAFPGGFPIIKDGAVMGGIGVSGGIAEDVFVAKAALAAGGFDLTEINAVLEQMGW